MPHNLKILGSFCTCGLKRFQPMQKKTDLKGCNDRQDKGTPLKCNYSYQLQPLDLHHKCCMHSGYYEGLGQGPGVPVINWVISSKNVVITLERSGDKQGLTLSLAELLIQFARKDCFSLGVDGLFSAGRSFPRLSKTWTTEVINVTCSADS